MARNPFLPPPPKKPKSIHWRVGTAKGTVGIPPVEAPDLTIAATPPSGPAYQKSPRGRPPKKPDLHASSNATPAPPDSPGPKTKPAAQSFPDAGKLSLNDGPFLKDANMHWGSNLDMFALAHGPVGCGGFAQATRLNMPEFVQGIESFTALHACTGLTDVDLEDAGDAKLAKALEEMRELFPLARGATVITEDPVALIDANIQGIAKTKAKEWGKPVIPVPRGTGTALLTATAAALKSAAKYQTSKRANQYDVAIPFYRGATGLVWIVSKLLYDIGLNPVHEFTGSSASDMAHLHQCKLVIGFAESLDVPPDYFPGGNAQLLRQWYGMPLIWTCFLGPTATDASLRAIAAHFGSRIQKRAEEVIAVNRAKLDAVIARYRPRLQGKLVLVHEIPDTQLELFNLLGMRVGNKHGWPGKTGVPRRPRMVCMWNTDPTVKSLGSYIEEAKPDLVHDRRRDEYDWKKRGLGGIAFSPVFDAGDNFLWGYDSFECFAAALDRAINAPWRKLIKPPWPVEDCMAM